MTYTVLEKPGTMVESMLETIKAGDLGTILVMADWYEDQGASLIAERLRSWAPHRPYYCCSTNTFDWYFIQIYEMHVEPFCAERALNSHVLAVGSVPHFIMAPLKDAGLASCCESSYLEYSNKGEAMASLVMALIDDLIDDKTHHILQELAKHISTKPCHWQWGHPTLI